MERFSDLELRGDRLSAVILTEGRASESLRELFIAGSATWPTEGIKIRPAHLEERGAVDAFPQRTGNEITVSCRASSELIEAINSGRNKMSVEFFPLKQRTTKSGVIEISKALITAAATVQNPAYTQTSAQLREHYQSIWNQFIWGMQCL